MTLADPLHAGNPFVQLSCKKSCKQCLDCKKRNPKDEKTVAVWCDTIWCDTIWYDTNALVGYLVGYLLGLQKCAPNYVIETLHDR